MRQQLSCKYEQSGRKTSRNAVFLAFGVSSGVEVWVVEILNVKEVMMQ